MYIYMNVNICIHIYINMNKNIRINIYTYIHEKEHGVYAWEMCVYVRGVWVRERVVSVRSYECRSCMCVRDVCMWESSTRVCVRENARASLYIWRFTRCVRVYAWAGARCVYASVCVCVCRKMYIWVRELCVREKFTGVCVWERDGCTVCWLDGSSVCAYMCVCLALCVSTCVWALCVSECWCVSLST